MDSELSNIIWLYLVLAHCFFSRVKLSSFIMFISLFLVLVHMFVDINSFPIKFHLKFMNGVIFLCVHMMNDVWWDHKNEDNHLFIIVSSIVLVKDCPKLFEKLCIYTNNSNLQTEGTWRSHVRYLKFCEKSLNFFLLKLYEPWLRKRQVYWGNLSVRQCH